MNRSTVHRALSFALISVFVSVLMAVLLAACSFAIGGDTATSQAVHADLTARLAEAQAAQAQALALWDRLIFGEAVSCEDAILAPSEMKLSSAERRVHTQASSIEESLNTAIRALHTSVDLWDGECVQIRENVPLATARDGRAAALSASEPLSTAAALLASWQ